MENKSNEFLWSPVDKRKFLICIQSLSEKHSTITQRVRVRMRVREKEKDRNKWELTAILSTLCAVICCYFFSFLSCQYENWMQRLQTIIVTRIPISNSKQQYARFTRFQRRFLPFGQTLRASLHTMLLLIFSLSLFLRHGRWVSRFLSFFCSLAHLSLSLLRSLNFNHCLYSFIMPYFQLFHILYQTFRIFHFFCSSFGLIVSLSCSPPSLYVYCHSVLLRFTQTSFHH